LHHFLLVFNNHLNIIIRLQKICLILFTFLPPFFYLHFTFVLHWLQFSFHSILQIDNRFIFFLYLTLKFLIIQIRILLILLVFLPPLFYLQFIFVLCWLQFQIRLVLQIGKPLIFFFYLLFEILMFESQFFELYFQFALINIEINTISYLAFKNGFLKRHNLASELAHLLLF
jgi:hypothetical protein